MHKKLIVYRVEIAVEPAEANELLELIAKHASVRSVEIVNTRMKKA